jgi:histidinol-phosphate aminotransferase
VSREEIVRVVEAAPQAAVLVDEAYFHFYGETVMDLIGRVPNLIVARTFSKAYGLAGLRLGLLAAAQEQMQWLRRVISPYSVNSLALACLPAALEDHAYIEWYVSEALEARGEFGAALDRLGVRYWPSQANFVLVHIGPKHAELAKAMRERGVLVRDRSTDPGCDGCVRITIGTREQTARGAQAMEQALHEIGWTGDAK